MALLYVLLGATVLYSLVQAIRHRVAMTQHRADRPDLSRLVSGEPEHAAKEAWLTAEGRDRYFNYRMYDALGVLAALAMILLWLGNNGLLDRILERLGGS